MPKKEDWSKRQDEIDPITGETRTFGHHHVHRSRGGYQSHGEGGVKKARIKDARQKLDPRDSKVKSSEIAEVPLKGRNRHARKIPRRKPPKK